VGREPAERLLPSDEVVGRQEVSEVRPQLTVVFVVEPFHRRFFYGAVHPFDLAVFRRAILTPLMFCQTVRCEAASGGGMKRGDTIARVRRA